MMLDLVSSDLPLAAPDPAKTERADAARNRARILEVAARLIDERGIENVSMHDVAEAASVGTGTLYRRFGDRAGLALALLDSDTIAFQNEFLFGPPPLGPGAPAVDRLRAWGERYLELMEEHAGLIGAAAARPGSGPEPMYATHLTMLLREAAPACDPEYTAQTLIAALNPLQHVYAREGLGWSPERLADGWRALIDALCHPA